MTWEKEFLDWFVAQLEAAVRKLPPPFRREIVQAVRPQGVRTDRAGRPNQAQRVPRPGELHIGSTGHPHPLLGDQQKTFPPITRRRDAALVAPRPAPWVPLPPLQYQIAVTRYRYQGQWIWLPSYPLVAERGWARPPCIPVPDATPERVPTYHKMMLSAYVGFAPEVFESQRPRMSEYLPMRAHRIFRHPFVAGVRNGRRFMRVPELPYFWLPERLEDQHYYFPSGDFAGQWFWYPTPTDNYAAPKRPQFNDPLGLTTGQLRTNTNVEHLHVPTAGTTPVQSSFPRGGWDVPPNYAFLSYLINYPQYGSALRDAFPDPVARFNLGMEPHAYRVLDVYEDGEVVDTGRGIVGRRVDGTADRVVREISQYGDVGLQCKHISHTIVVDDGVEEDKIASAWDHVVYDPEGLHPIGSSTVASGGVSFTMAFLMADDISPTPFLQSRLDYAYYERVSKPLVEGHVLYEGAYGALPAPGSGEGRWFCGHFLDGQLAGAEVVRGVDDHPLCVVVRDDDSVTVSRGSPSGVNWEVVWTGTLTEALPSFGLGYLSANLPSFGLYRWMHPVWPTPVGILFIRGASFYCWEYRHERDRLWRGWESPPLHMAPLDERCPVILVPNGRSPAITGAALPGEGWY